ncbi:MAG: dihydroorotate dehydrogenase (quinone), partial [Phenylobacterium sp.]
WGLCDYFTVNISSPNTPGLRALQTKAALEDLLGRVKEARDGLRGASDPPVFLKVAPDLEDGEADAIVETAVAQGLAGIMVSNTTLSRPPLRSRFRAEAGGLSGAPLTALSTAVLRRFAEAARGRLALVGVGGISSGSEAYEKIRAGACAVQLYSALVFEGPGLVTRIKRELAQRLRADGFSSVAQAIGAV